MTPPREGLTVEEFASAIRKGDDPAEILRVAIYYAEASALERAAQEAEAMSSNYDKERAEIADGIADAIRAMLAPSPESPPAEDPLICGPACPGHSEPVAPAPSAAEKRIAELEQVLREAREHLLSYWRTVGSRPSDLSASIDAALASPGAAGEDSK